MYAQIHQIVDPDAQTPHKQANNKSSDACSESSDQMPQFPVTRSAQILHKQENDPRTRSTE